MREQSEEPDKPLRKSNIQTKNIQSKIVEHDEDEDEDDNNIVLGSPVTGDGVINKFHETVNKKFTLTAFEKKGGKTKRKVTRRKQKRRKSNRRKSNRSKK